MGNRCKQKSERNHQGLITAVYIATTIGGILICVQDINRRLIHIGAFLILATGVILNNIIFHNSYTHLNTGINIAFLLFILAILRVHIFIKSGKHEKFLDKYFGLGDIITLAILAFACNFSNYLSIIILSSMAGLAYGLVLKLRRTSRTLSIPFAGLITITYLIAFYYSSYISTNLFYHNIIPLY